MHLMIRTITRLLTLAGIASVLTLTLVTPAAGHERVESFHNVPDTSRSVVTVEEAKALVEADAAALCPAGWDPDTRSAAQNLAAPYLAVTRPGGFRVFKVSTADALDNLGRYAVVRACAS